MPKVLCHARLVLLALLLAGCTSSMRADSPPAGVPSHHRGDRFQNNYGDFEPKSLGALIRWRLNAWREDLPREPAMPTPTARPDPAVLRGADKPTGPALTWIGHASMLAQLGGINVLTDPMFSERASPFSFVGPKRHVAPGVALVDLPHIDAVVISHNHYDHLDLPSVQALAAQPGGPPRFIVPLGLKAWFAEQGIASVIELDWWQSATIGAVEIVMTPVQHWSGRSLVDRMKTLWAGYAMFAPDFQLYFAGDTGYTKDFADIHARFASRHGGAGRGFDVALIPIGAYEPRWFMAQQHANPAEAVQIHLDLAAERSIGIHWGTFVLTDESLDEPPRALAAARQERGLADEAFSVLAIGETRRFAPRRP